MSNFVLVHGAWHGGWCWHKVKAHLDDNGHNVAAPDLPLDRGLNDYVEAVVAALEPFDDPVILVGHSMAGAVISQVAERVPDRIERLVFLAAFALRDGECINDLAGQSLASALRDNMEMSDDGMVTVKERVIAGAFYHDCGEEDIGDAKQKLRPQNPAAFATPVELTDANYGRVPTQYIECIEDQAIPIALQRRMARNIGCTLINSLPTGHSPFLSQPASLAARLATVGIKDSRYASSPSSSSSS